MTITIKQSLIAMDAGPRSLSSAQQGPKALGTEEIHPLGGRGTQVRSCVFERRRVKGVGGRPLKKSL